jgi:hypothetical protein
LPSVIGGRVGLPAVAPGGTWRGYPSAFECAAVRASVTGSPGELSGALGTRRRAGPSATLRASGCEPCTRRRPVASGRGPRAEHGVVYQLSLAPRWVAERPPGDRASLLDKPLDRWSASLANCAGHRLADRCNILIYRCFPRRFMMVPGEGFEPPTFGLQNRCTATVLTRLFRVARCFGSRIALYRIAESDVEAAGGI